MVESVNLSILFCKDFHFIRPIQLNITIMKKSIFTCLLVSMLLLSCKNSNETQRTHESPIEEVAATNTTIADYPTSVSQIFNAHGGVQNWNDMNTLSYEILKGEVSENHTVSLKDRRVKINHPDWSIGYDGADVWLLQNEEEAYKGNARFYHNLYFYFYAMPFVLGDDGITYEMMEPTQLLDKEYHGIKVSYNDGVGDSPKDEYILYYDPDTNRMEWLGYTVTYKSNEKSEKWNFINYSEWATVNELLLPKRLTWYTSENNSPKEIRSDVEFLNVQISGDMSEDVMFEMPNGAEIIKR